MKVLKEFYGINNEHKPQPLNEITLNRIIEKHGKDGFVIVSANRSDKSNEENNKNTKKLIEDIKKFGYGYCHVYGGYHGSDGVVDSYEPSFIIFNHKKFGEEGDFSELKLFAIQMCEKYGQNSVLIKAPGKAPDYVNSEGDVVGKGTDKEVEKNNPDAEFYTSLIKSQNLDYQNPERLKRFTYDIKFECYINPGANTLNELRQRREGYGEIVLNFGDKEIF